MGLEENKAIIRRYYDELWNQKKGEVIDEIAYPDMKIHMAPGQAHRPISLHKWFETALIAFPDVQFTVHHMIAEGDYVAAHWTYLATNTGEFLGYEATNKQVTDVGINIFHIEDGKISEFWIVQDSLGLMQQLGHLPQ